jgi:hypothetical protein
VVGGALLVLVLLLCSRLSAAFMTLGALTVALPAAGSAARAVSMPRMCSPVQTLVDPAVAALVLNLCVSRASKDWASLRRPQGVAMEDGDRGETVGLYEAAVRRGQGALSGRT